MRIFVVVFLLILFFQNNLSIIWGEKIDLAKLKKQEEERRKKAGKKVLVVTNENINLIEFKDSRYSFLVLKSTPKNEETKSETPGISDDIPQDNQNQKEYWMNLKTQLKQQVESLRQTVNQQQLQWNKLNTDYLIMDMPEQKQAIKNELDILTEQLNQNKTRLIELENRLSNLEDEARQAGVPPGWVR